MKAGVGWLRGSVLCPRAPESGTLRSGSSSAVAGVGVRLSPSFQHSNAKIGLRCRGSQSVASREAESLVASSSGAAGIDESWAERYYHARKRPREMARSERLDASNRLRSPRAARELALCTLYTAMTRDVDPVSVFDERLNQRVGRNFDRNVLELYSHNPADVGKNETEEDEQRAATLIQNQEEEADVEAAVLLAPLPLVYSRFVLRLCRMLVRNTSERWVSQEKVLKSFFPKRWLSEPETAWLPLIILQLAVTEIEVSETSTKVVVNEAVDLTKRFCDGAAPRIVHGILGRYLEYRERDSQVLS